MFFNIIQTGATGVCAGDKFKASGMFGPVFLVSKKTFNELNGFENVKDETVEDFTLGKIYEENGEKIELFLGGKLISFRMYPNGLKSLIEGWTKNFSKGAASINPFTLLAFIVWVAYLTVLPIVITASIINQKTVILIILCIIYLLTVLSLVRISKAIGSYPLACHVFYPVLIVLFHLLFIYSVLSIYIFKSTKWKGRKL
jgi:4,4'-diaponeurosporenoate glycosyltransferase